MLDALPASHLDGYNLLREAIVIQAAADLRGVLAGKKMPFPCSADELYRFFHGEWGGMLLGGLDGEALYDRIAKEVEEEKMAAMQEYEEEIYHGQKQ
jgi:hypothetical protein